MPLRPLVFAAVLLVSIFSYAQAQMPDMPGMDMGKPKPQTPTQATAAQRPAAQDSMPSMATPEMRPAQTLLDAVLDHTSSGTSIQPASTPMAMWMGDRGGWQFMLHGDAFLSDTQQHATDSPTAPAPSICSAYGLACVTPTRRGADKLFSSNWIMPMATHPLGHGQLTLRTMLDLEPATIPDGNYPELFQQGETAGGKPIVDGQHPHDFVMELAALYDYRAGEHTLLSLYAAPVGDPALGPTAYPHRLSASEDPIAALGHHQEDSTHIAFSVLTAGLIWRPLRIEVSGFHGAEPDEARWHFQPSPNGLAPDSYSARLTYAPNRNWAAQYSAGHLTAPEQLHPNENQFRQTASVMYNRPLAQGNWSTTALWGHTRSLPTDQVEDSYLLESLLNFRTRNYVWTRIEAAARTTELLLEQFPGNPDAPEITLGHVAAYSLGYDRDYRPLPHLLVAPGAQFTVYRTPDALASTYGRDPFGAVVFLRFRIQ